MAFNQHFSNPVLAGLDVLSAGAIVGWWLDGISHPIGTISTLLAGIWYAYLIFEAIERRIKSRRKRH